MRYNTISCLDCKRTREERKRYSNHLPRTLAERWATSLAITMMAMKINLEYCNWVTDLPNLGTIQHLRSPWGSPEVDFVEARGGDRKVRNNSVNDPKFCYVSCGRAPWKKPPSDMACWCSSSLPSCAYEPSGRLKTCAWKRCSAVTRADSSKSGNFFFVSSRTSGSWRMPSTS